MFKNTGKYDDIVTFDYKKYKNERKRNYMTKENRAGQFSAFSALVGYKDIIKQSEKIFVKKKDLDDNQKAILDFKFNIIKQMQEKNVDLEVKYFKKNFSIEDGEYKNIKGILKKIDFNKKIFKFEDGTLIEMENIIEIKGEIFEKYFNIE